MGQIMVQVDAQGSVSDDLRLELAGVLADEDESVVTLFRGNVLDKAAFMGLLHRLRHAGLRILNVDALPDPNDAIPAEPQDHHEVIATVDIAGRIDNRIASLLGEGQVIRELTTSTVLFRLEVESELFAVLEMIESLNLDLLHVRLHPDAHDLVRPL